MKNETGFIGIIFASVIAVVCLSVTLTFTYVLWPLFRLIVRLLWKGIQKIARKARARIKTPKAKAPAPSLPTPAIFQGMSNLAPAKQIRLR